jgi:hypothetical protein
MRNSILHSRAELIGPQGPQDIQGPQGGAIGATARKVHPARAWRQRPKQ